MKCLLTVRFLLLDYEQFLFLQFQHCLHGKQNVHVESLHLLARTNAMEIEIQLVSRFLDQLNYSVRDEMCIQPISTLFNAYKLALKVEMSLAWKESIRGEGLCRNFDSNRTSTRKNLREDQDTSKPRYRNEKKPIRDEHELQKKQLMKQPQPTNTKTLNPYAKYTGDKCNRCEKSGYTSNNCPNHRQVNLVEHVVNNEDVKDYVYGAESGNDITVEKEYDSPILVICRLLLSPKREES